MKRSEGPGSFNAVVRMLIVTGQRLNEVASMTWSEINPDLSVWTIPGSKAKNKVTHLVPLSSQSRTIIEAAPRVDGQTLVFPGRRGAFNGWSKSKASLDKRSGVTGWTLHDLRRTMATGLQKLGVRLEVTEAVLNHVSGSRAGIVGVYQRHEWKDEKRAALTAWGARVAAIVEGSERGKCDAVARAAHLDDNETRGDRPASRQARRSPLASPSNHRACAGARAMNDDEWIPFMTALVMLGGGKDAFRPCPKRSCLRRVRSRGLRITDGPDETAGVIFRRTYWAEWRFRPEQGSADPPRI